MTTRILQDMEYYPGNPGSKDARNRKEVSDPGIRASDHLRYHCAVSALAIVIPTST